MSRTKKYVWTPFAIPCATAAGTRTEDGFVCGALGVRQDWLSPDWHVIHLPSGYAFPCDFISKAEAIMFAERLFATGFDWSRIGAMTKRSSRYREAVQAFRSVWGSR